MLISVIVCTYNRSEFLAAALQSLTESQLPDSIEWEILVIDNNSTDHTRETIEVFERKYPRRLRYIFEPQQGKSYALNTGIRESKGRIVAFIDDDAAADPKWLWNLTHSVLEGGWAGAGGPIQPNRDFSPPAWLPMEGPWSMAGVLAFFDQGNRPHDLSVPPYGTNMCFRKEVFSRYGGFRTDLGPRPGNLIRNEDTEFGRRLLAAGERIKYQPDAIVYHPVPENRLRKDYFLAWWFDDGRARVRESGNGPARYGIPRHYLRVPRILLTRLPKLVCEWMSASDSQQRFIRKCWVWTTVGEVAEMLRLGRQPDSVSSIHAHSHEFLPDR